MTTALLLQDAYIQTLWQAQLLCDVCQERPWTQTARWVVALICAGCAEGEPEPDA
jgi:hypothetical protein